jgi:hypothetical protein
MLDLWSRGHSARAIADQLGISRRTVESTVHHARDIGDPRAALHVGRNGRPIGHPGRGMRVLLAYPDVEVVPAIPPALCKYGHARTAENLDKRNNCRTCQRIKGKARRERARQ